MFLYNDILNWVSAIILLELIMGASAILPSRHAYQRVSSPQTANCPPLRSSGVVVFVPHHRDSPWSTRECGRGHVVETTVLLLTTWLSTSSLVLPGRRRRQQLSLLSTPCIPLLPALVDCQMPHDDTVVVIFVVIASVISHLVLTCALTPR